MELDQIYVRMSSGKTAKPTIVICLIFLKNLNKFVLNIVRQDSKVFCNTCCAEDSIFIHVNIYFIKREDMNTFASHMIFISTKVPVIFHLWLKNEINVR